MDHPTPQQLADLSLGRLPPEEVDTVAAHLDECTACRSAVVKHDDTVEDSLVAAARAPQADPFAEPQRDAALAAAERLVGDSADSAEADEWKTEFLASADSSESSDVQGKVIGEYVILNKIGAGGMGEVYKARHRRMKRIVALKLLPNAAMATPEAVKRFRREVEAAARLMHPNIVVAHDAGEADGVHFLVMEYVEGEDLAAIVKQRGPLPIEQAVSYGLQAAAGLSYAHSQGIVHRDIKPSNLLLDKNGKVKILDMGLARVDVEAVFAADADGQREELTNSGQVMGTADYMAPEQSLDTRTADAKADVYSLGCTLFRLVTGRTPYVADSVLKRFLAHREEPIPSATALRPEVPRRLDDLLRRMLAKRASARPSMDDVIAELSALKAQASGGRGKRPPSRIAVAAAGAAAFFAMLGVWVIVRDKHGDEVGRMKVPEQGSVVVQDGTTTKPADPADPEFEARATAVGADRAVAEWVRSLDATVELLSDGKRLQVGSTSPLPSGVFSVVKIEFFASKPPATTQLSRLRRLTQLEDLTMAYSPTTDDGLAAVCRIPRLRKLSLSFVGFSAAGWKNLAQLKRIEELSLRLVRLGEPEIKAISEAGSLQSIDLTYCAIFGSGIEYFARMPQLQHLGLNSSVDAVWQGLARLQESASLKSLAFMAGKCTDAEAHTLCKLSRITKVEWQSSPITDEGLRILAGMKGLQTLTLHNAFRLTPQGVADFRKARPDVKLDWKPLRLPTTPGGTGSTPAAVAGGAPLATAPFSPEQAKAYQEASASLLGTPSEFINSVGMKLTLIPAGDFQMGSSDEQIAAATTLGKQVRADQLSMDKLAAERPRHRVVITRPYYLGTYEVTVGAFRTFVEANGYKTDAERRNEARVWAKPNYEATEDMPVTVVSWNDAVAFCDWLSKREGRKYRLPTEAEWEFACRAGTETHYSFGDDPPQLDAHGWIRDNAGGKSNMIGRKRPNPFGLFDMHGNAWEWCRDVFDVAGYGKSPMQDPGGPSTGGVRVFRGGSWLSAGGQLAARSAFRYGLIPSAYDNHFGFRCVCEVAVDDKDAAPIVSVSPSLFDAGAEEYSERAVVEWLQSIRGEMKLRKGDRLYGVSPSSTLPAGDFTIESVLLSNSCAPTDRELRYLASLSNLKTVHISRSPFTEAGIATITAIPGLEGLGLSRMPISAASMRRIAAIPNLKRLFLPYVDLSEDAMNVLPDIRSLEKIDLYGTKLSPAVVKRLTALPKLNGLVIQDTINDELMADVAKAPLLEEIVLYNHSHGSITPTGLRQLAKLKSLKRVGLWGLGYSDAHVAELAKMPQLELIDFWQAPVTDTGLRHLESLKQLKLLVIQSGTKITPEGRKRLKDALPKLTISDYRSIAVW